MKLKEAIPDSLLRTKTGYNLDLVYSLKDDAAQLSNSSQDLSTWISNIGVWMESIDVDHIEMRKVKGEYAKLRKESDAYERKVSAFVKLVRKL